MLAKWHSSSSLHLPLIDMQKEIQEKIAGIIEQQQSLLLSTIVKPVEISQTSTMPQTETSYAPYVFDQQQQAFYVFLSDLANHTEYLRHNPKASILIIEDETGIEQIFARVRVQYQILSEAVTDSEEQQSVIHAMQQRFGDIISVLASLSDFHLFKFKPQNGRYVEGFGRAFLIQQGLDQNIIPAMQDQR